MKKTAVAYSRFSAEDEVLFDNSKWHHFFWFIRKIWIPLFKHKSFRRDFNKIDEQWSGKDKLPKFHWKWVQIREKTSRYQD